MQHIRFLAAMTVAVSILVLAAACAPAPAPAPTAAVPTVAPSAMPLSPPPTSAATTVLPTATPTALPPTATLAPATATKPPASATASARPTIPPNFPLATFTMSDRDGKWTISFGSDGSYQVTLNGRVTVSGTFTVREDLIILYDASGSKACPNDNGGAYRWTFDGTQFKLQGVSDQCAARARTLSGSLWTKQP